MGPQSSGFSPSRWLTNCSRPHPFWNSHSSNPRSHPAAEQSWTDMELNREIQSEYKQVMFQMNNTLSIPARTCNKNSHVFLSLHWEQLFAWFLRAADNTTPLIVWITHYNVYSLPFVVRVSRLCLNSIHLSIGLDADCVHSRPPSVTLYADGLKMNRNKTKTFCNIEYLFNQPDRIIIKYKTEAYNTISYEDFAVNCKYKLLTYICTLGVAPTKAYGYLHSFHIACVCKYACVCVCVCLL